MISVIIPTYNEAERIAQTIMATHSANGIFPIEIIVADGGSSDNTIGIATGQDATVIKSEQKGRAAQMNKGAAAARGDILYFLHADTIPPLHFTEHILKASDQGAVAGCFRLLFDHKHWFLKAHSWFTRFDINAVRFGDQSLFITKDVFEKCGGFREDLQIMEDQEIISRIKTYGKFKVMNAHVTTSARKYLEHGVYKVQSTFYRLWMLYYLGYPQEYLIKIHRKLSGEN